MGITVYKVLISSDEFHFCPLTKLYFQSLPMNLLSEVSIYLEKENKRSKIIYSLIHSKILVLSPQGI